jgi:hypothetical protein
VAAREKKTCLASLFKPAMPLERSPILAAQRARGAPRDASALIGLGCVHTELPVVRALSIEYGSFQSESDRIRVGIRNGVYNKKQSN